MKSKTSDLRTMCRRYMKAPIVLVDKLKHTRPSLLVLIPLVLTWISNGDIIDRFPYVRNRSHLEALVGAATVYKTGEVFPTGLYSVLVGESVLYGLSEDALSSTRDGGQKWTALSIDPSELLGGPGHTVYAKTKIGVYRTQDNGGSWTPTIPPGGYDYRSLFVLSGGTAYAAGPAGLYSSLDRGQTWQKVTTALTGSVDKIAVSGNILVVLHSISSGFLTFSSKLELYKSQDGSRTWVKLSYPQGGIGDLVVFQGMVYVLAGGRIVKEGESETWRQVKSTEKYISSLKAAGRRLYILAESELYMSEDGAQSWSRLLTPKGTLGAFAVAGEDVVVSIGWGKDTELYYSRDGGRQWERLTRPDAPIIGMTIVDGTMFVRTEIAAFSLSLHPRGTWQRFSHLLPNLGYSHTAFSFLDNNLFLLASSGLFKSSDLGANWHPPLTSASSKSFLVSVDEDVFVGGEDHILKSRGTGASWEELPIPQHEKVVLLKPLAGKLYLVTSQREAETKTTHIWQWVEGKASWERIGTTSGFSVKNFVVDKDGTMYVSTEQQVLRKTKNEDWKNISLGLLVDQSIYSLHLSEQGILFVGTQKGLYWSNDRGMSWNRASGELGEYQSVNSIIPYSAEGFLLIGDRASLYVCVNKLNPPPPMVSTRQVSLIDSGSPVDEVVLPISPTQGLSKVIVGSLEIPEESLQRTESSVVLRGDSKAIQQLPEGLNLVEWVRSGAQKLRENYYIWKENKSASVYKPYGKSYATIIAPKYGQDRDFGPLPDAVTQGAQVAELLRAQGFEVKTFYNEEATKAKIERYLLEELKTQLKKDDRVLIYFSGHGYTKTDAMGKQLGYFVTYGAGKSSIEFEAIPMSRIESEYARNLEAKHVLFVLDACFSGLALTRTDFRSPEQLAAFQTLVEIRRLTQEKNRSVLAAGGRDDPALDVNGGIFTTAFINGIRGRADRNHDGVVNLTELFDEVRGVVAAEAARRGFNQLPQFETLSEYGSGEFIFIYNK